MTVERYSEGLLINNVPVPFEQLAEICLLAGEWRAAADIFRVFRKKFEVSNVTPGIIRAYLTRIRKAERNQHEAPLTPMARAQSISYLTNHRGPDGRIDWDGIRGYYAEAAAV